MAKSYIYIIFILLVCADVRAQNPIFGSSITLSGDSGHTFPSYTQTWLLDSGTRANDTLTFSTVAPDSAQVWMYDGHGHIAWTTVSGGGGGLSQIYGVSPISITGTDTVNISGVLVTAPTSGSQNTIIPVGATVGLTLEQPAAFSANAATYIGSGGSPTHVLFDALGIAPVVAGGTGLATLPAHDVMAGNGTGTPNFIAPSTSGNVLESNGTDWISGALSFADSSRAANKSDTANMQHVITFSGSTTGLTPATATSGAITLGGTLAIANGGTGGSSTSQNFVFAGPTSGSGAPSFRALVSGDIPSLSYLSNVLTTTGDIIYSSSGSTASRLGIGSTNNVLSVISGVPSWQPASSVFGDTIFSNGIGTATAPGFVLANTTASTSGATIQAPPPLYFDWHQRSTTATAADSERLIRIRAVPVSGVNPPAFSLEIASGNANVGYTVLLSLSSTGKMKLPAGIGNGGFAYFDHTDQHLEVGSFGGNQVPYFNALSSPFACTNDFTFNAGTLGLGHSSTSTGKLNISGTTSGTISVTTLASAGTATDTLISDPGAIVTASRASNGTMGTGTLASGTVTINTTSVKTGSMIFLTDAGGGVAGNIGSLEVGTITNNTSFVVNSSNVLDSSNFNWWIINP